MDMNFAVIALFNDEDGASIIIFIITLLCFLPYHLLTGSGTPAGIAGSGVGAVCLQAGALLASAACYVMWVRRTSTSLTLKLCALAAVYITVTFVTNVLPFYLWG